MDNLVIEGGACLSGTVDVSGAKNAALPIIASALLGGRLTLSNVPALKDVDTMCRLLVCMGGTVERDGNNLIIEVDHLDTCKVLYDLVKTMRASVLVLGPLLAKYGEAIVSLPGGCAIGARPIDIHIVGLKKMGAEINLEHGYVHAKAVKLKGAYLNLDFPTVTGTENLLMAAVLADGTTIIENAACEPEITDLADSLNKRGAKITGAGTPRIEIEGIEKLTDGEHAIMPDRIEACTFMVAGAASGGDIVVKGCHPMFVESVLRKLSEAGADIEKSNSEIRVKMKQRAKHFNLTTMPYPGFPTDMQAQMMALASIADGSSIFKETIFERRLLHVEELRRMGAEISVSGSSAVVKGVKSLAGADVMASDLRASASLIIAGLVAEGRTRIYRIYHLDRGYSNIETKLAALGATIRREKDN